MAGASLLTLLDDISVILDDVSVMTKVAAKKTAGVLGDDLALNAEQVTGVKAQLVHAVGVSGEPGLEVDALGLELLLMGLERLPSGGRRSVDRCGNSCHKVLLSIRAHTSMRPDNQIPLF